MYVDKVTVISSTCIGIILLSNIYYILNTYRVYIDGYSIYTLYTLTYII